MQNGSSNTHTEPSNAGRKPSIEFCAPSVSQAATLSSHVRQQKKLLWVDDNKDMLLLYKSVFESLGFEIWTTSSPQDALEARCLSTIDLAILDYEMPELDGGELASLIKNLHPQMPVILYSGSPSIPNEAHDWVDAICSKGGPRGELLSTIERLTSVSGSSGLAAAG